MLPKALKLKSWKSCQENHTIHQSQKAGVMSSERKMRQHFLRAETSPRIKEDPGSHKNQFVFNEELSQKATLRQFVLFALMQKEPKKSRPKQGKYRPRRRVPVQSRCRGRYRSAHALQPVFFGPANSDFLQPRAGAENGIPRCALLFLVFRPG